jgi:hypothetical protein
MGGRSATGRLGGLGRSYSTVSPQLPFAGFVLRPASGLKARCAGRVPSTQRQPGVYASSLHSATAAPALGAQPRALFLTGRLHALAVSKSGKGRRPGEPFQKCGPPSRRLWPQAPFGFYVLRSGGRTSDAGLDDGWMRPRARASSLTGAAASTLDLKRSGSFAEPPRTRFQGVYQISRQVFVGDVISATPAKSAVDLSLLDGPHHQPTDHEAFDTDCLEAGLAMLLLPEFRPSRPHRERSLAVTLGQREELCIFRPKARGH